VTDLFAGLIPLGALQGLGVSGSGAAFATSAGDILEVSSYGPGVFRLRAGPRTRPDYGLVPGRAKPCTVEQPRPGTHTFTSGDVSLEITDSPLRIRLLRHGVPVFRSVTDERRDGSTRLPCFGRQRQGDLWMAAFALASGERVYGLGEKFGPLDKRGQLIHSQVVDAQGVNTGLAYKNTPFAWSPGTGSGAWGLFVNTPGTVTHGIGHPDWSHRSYALLVEDEALDLYLFVADAPAGIIDRYTQLTGRAPAVPAWSLGLWVSCGLHRSPEEAIDVAARLREHRIPCDVLALDRHASGKTERHFGFDRDPDGVRSPRDALARIRAQHLRICAWEYPYVSVHDPLFHELASQRYLLTTAHGDPYVMGVDPTPEGGAVDGGFSPPQESGIVDFTHPGAFAWWRDAHGKLFADGVDVIQIDFGEQVPDDAVAFNGDRGKRLHNVYPLLYSQCIFDATARYQRDEAAAPVVWARAGWAGSQRYPIHRGGEAQSDWEGLAASIRGGLSWGMSGAPYHATDVGGCYGSAPPTPELFVRWLQAAVFASHLRVHAHDQREPWAFGQEAETVARKWLALRYRLVPYLQSVIAQAVATGLPVTRAMPLAFPGASLVRGYETQFMCGDSLLVAPIVQPGGEVEVALPPGAWYDLNSRQRIPGQRVLRYRAGLDQFPVFGREGHALPLGPAVQHTGEIDPGLPLDALWLFGKPTQPLAGFAQARIDPDPDGALAVRAMPGVAVVHFGDATATPVGVLGPPPEGR
jgi:alpha-D-xyloside xylohydrolase